MFLPTGFHAVRLVAELSGGLVGGLLKPSLN